MLTATLVSDHEDARARRSRRARQSSFQWGWDSAARFQLGLPPAAFGCGPKRDRDYVDGWNSCCALGRALRPCAAERGGR